MFEKVLIANRGEIACRVIRTARAMGIETIAVYSEADADALHVEMADEAVAIGPPPAAESYLRGDKIIEAAQDTGAEAIHPGYGFLAENAEFVRAVEKAGLSFIGPPAAAIAEMGDKIASKKIAREAGVNVIPGGEGEIADLKAARAAAGEIGYPVMIKASAGGGGKGMRVAKDEAALEEGFASAKSEARSSFGDERILIEKFIERPRHIEVQVLGDRQGNLAHLFERECSIQRRHQKIVEEAPSPFLDQKTRAAMGEQAVALAKAVGYHSAGTVEFVVGPGKDFYFLEMNTRLQVEHPVTEKITGRDLVADMIRIAAGEKLGFAQEDLAIDGWAIEARIYAEDPARGFLPSIGRLQRYLEPEGEGIRVDSGVFEGGEISMFYDPLIAKLVASGSCRAEALSRMARALDAFYIRGIAHNVQFLGALMAHPAFGKGDFDTGFLAREYKDGAFRTRPDKALEERLAAVAVYLRSIEAMRERQIAGRRGYPEPAPEGWAVTLGGANRKARVDCTDEGVLVRFGGRKIAVESRWKPGQPVFYGEVGGAGMFVEIDRLPLGYILTSAGESRRAGVVPARLAGMLRRMPPPPPGADSRHLVAPMPGLVVAINVGEGEEVRAGQALAVVEAMKMENILRAERDGVIKKILAREGDSLAVDAVIMEFE